MGNSRIGVNIWGAICVKIEYVFIITIFIKMMKLWCDLVNGTLDLVNGTLDLVNGMLRFSKWDAPI